MHCVASIEHTLVDALRGRLRDEGVTHPHAVDVLLRHALAHVLPNVPIGQFPIGVHPVVDGDYTKVAYILAEGGATNAIKWPEHVAEMFER